jgi:hypothetical protein
MSATCPECLERTDAGRVHVCRPSRQLARLVQSLRKTDEPAGASPSLRLVASAQDQRPKIAPFRPFDEATAALPAAWKGSPITRLLVRWIQLICIVYALFLLYWVWLAKDVTLGLLLRDPVFYSYSILVSIYVLARFALAPFYKPTATRATIPKTGSRWWSSTTAPPTRPGSTSWQPGSDTRRSLASASRTTVASGPA